jgi:hypothetical protein
MLEHAERLANNFGFVRDLDKRILAEHDVEAVLGELERSGLDKPKFDLLGEARLGRVPLGSSQKVRIDIDANDPCSTEISSQDDGGPSGAAPKIENGLAGYVDSHEDLDNLLGTSGGQEALTP